MVKSNKMKIINAAAIIKLVLAVTAAEIVDLSSEGCL